MRIVYGVSGEGFGHAMRAKELIRSLIMTGHEIKVITYGQAYDELKSGNAYVGSYFGSGKSVSITKVSLAYYMGRTRQNYLYPVYVFEGTDGFTAYISALDDAWTVKNETAN